MKKGSKRMNLDRAMFSGLFTGKNAPYLGLAAAIVHKAQQDMLSCKPGTMDHKSAVSFLQGAGRKMSHVLAMSA